MTPRDIEGHKGGSEGRGMKGAEAGARERKGERDKQTRFRTGTSFSNSNPALAWSPVHEVVGIVLYNTN